MIICNFNGFQEIFSFGIVSPQCRVSSELPSVKRKYKIRNMVINNEKKKEKENGSHSFEWENSHMSDTVLCLTVSVVAVSFQRFLHMFAKILFIFHWHIYTIFLFYFFIEIVSTMEKMLVEEIRNCPKLL